MAKYPKLVAIVIVLATVKIVQGEVVSLLYHASVNFTCDPSPSELGVPSPVSGQRYVWILPTGELVDADTTDHPRVQVLQDGYILHVKKVDNPDFGLYHCLVYDYTHSSYMLSRHGINLGGPYYGDLFAIRYRRMLITGAVAAAICVVVMGTFCFLYNRQQLMLDKPRPWHDPEDDIDMDTLPPKTTPQSLYVNRAFTETEGNGSTPRAEAEAESEGNGTAVYQNEIDVAKNGKAPVAPATAKQMRVVAADDYNDDDDVVVVIKTKL